MEEKLFQQNDTTLARMMTKDSCEFAYIYQIAPEASQARMLEPLCNPEKTILYKRLIKGQLDFMCVYRVVPIHAQSKLLMRLFFRNGQGLSVLAFNFTLKQVKELIIEGSTHGSALRSLCNARTVADLKDRVKALIEGPKEVPRQETPGRLFGHAGHMTAEGGSKPEVNANSLIK